ncbi:MAG: SIMPL domain-containing protein [Parvularcula sp.]
MRIALFAALPIMMACTVQPSDAQEPTAMQEFQRTLSVSGTGNAAAVPDLAILTFGVQAQGNTAGEALSANSAHMNKVVNTLKGMGIEPRDLQTSNFSLNPLYSRDARGRMDTNQIIGYRTTNTLTVRVRDTGKVGETIDKAVGAGANNFQGLSFGFQDSGALLEEARRKAVRNARAIADLMAEEAGVKIGTVLTMNENSYNPQPRPMARMMAMDAEAAPAPIEAGESELSVTVNIVYSLK